MSDCRTRAESGDQECAGPSSAQGWVEGRVAHRAEGWHVPRDSFFQNNFFLLPRLLEVVRERLQDSGTHHLVDLYCGVGFFSLELAHQVESFVGIELDRLAIDAARRNANCEAAPMGNSPPEMWRSYCQDPCKI